MLAPSVFGGTNVRKLSDFVTMISSDLRYICNCLCEETGVDMEEKKTVAIIGSGPAGFTAAIYAARAMLRTIIFEGNQPGGQLMITTDVENYPGFENGILGPELMEKFRKQAHRFGAESIYEYVTAVDFSQRPFVLRTDKKEYTADAVIIATGASAKLLGVPGEKEYMGYGVSTCATCDGFFFRDQDVIVVGGGDSAMEEALYLTHHARSVTIVHRRDQFRASKIMLHRARNHPKIRFILNTVVEEFIGSTENGVKKLTAVKLRNVKTGETFVQKIDGVFIAIGHKPNTEIFRPWLDMDEQGYIQTRGKTTYTNIPGVFAAGDVQDPRYRQAVTAAGSGCMAAIDASRWLEEQAAENIPTSQEQTA